MSQGDDEMVVTVLDAVAADPETRLYEASSAGDLEVPLVPRAAQEIRLGAADGGATLERDAADGPPG